MSKNSNTYIQNKQNKGIKRAATVRSVDEFLSRRIKTLCNEGQVMRENVPVIDKSDYLESNGLDKSEWVVDSDQEEDYVNEWPSSEEGCYFSDTYGENSDFEEEDKDIFNNGKYTYYTLA